MPQCLRSQGLALSARGQGGHRRGVGKIATLTPMAGHAQVLSAQLQQLQEKASKAMHDAEMDATVMGLSSIVHELNLWGI